MADLLGYAASCAVLATFLMRTMAPLRLVAILSNLLFALFGYVQHIHPVLFLRMVLLPINSWRLFAHHCGPDYPPQISYALLASRVALRPGAFWFAVGLLVGLTAPLTIILTALLRHV